MPTGEGVTNSPSSPLTSAITPANGARSWLRSRCAFVTSMRASATRVASSAAVHAAALDSACLALGRWLPPTRDARSCSFMRRSASRFATFAVTHTSRARERDARASRSASSSSALMSSFQSSSSNAPASTRSPSLTGRLAIWPPSAGERPARRHASTVPARVFATVAATGPRSTASRATLTGCGLDNTHAAPATTSTTTATIAIRFIRSPQRVHGPVQDWHERSVWELIRGRGLQASAGGVGARVCAPPSPRDGVLASPERCL